MSDWQDMSALDGPLGGWDESVFERELWPEEVESIAKADAIALLVKERDTKCGFWRLSWCWYDPLREPGVFHECRRHNVA